ncbi:hypothetical protein KBA73_05640 [Patescibacteria group bacterium]|nr:hypothetical protein [Patescibacteria group bacterium]
MQERFLSKQTPRADSVVSSFTRSTRYARDWDEEFFREAFEALSQEFQNASPEERRRILMDRYFDATRPYQGQRQSRFQTQFVSEIPNVSFDLDSDDTVQQGNVLVRIAPEAKRFIVTRPVSAYQYGPSRIFDVPAGSWLEVSSLHEQDLIGTTDLTACSVVIARGPRTFFLAHVLGSNPEQLTKLIAQLEARLDIESVDLTSPFWREEDETEQKDWNDRIRNIGERFNIPVSWFPYIGYKTLNPHRIESTTVIARPEFTRSVGTNFTQVPGSSMERPQYRTTVIPVTINDLVQ